MDNLFEIRLVVVVCFNTTSTVLSAVRVRVKVRVGVTVRVKITSHPARHSRVFWFWSHDEVMI